MQEPTDTQLLRDYAERRNEAAFRELVSRHADVVYASALRQVSSPDLAQDIAQTVFTDLARKAQPLAGKLTGDTSLLDWLYRSTRFLALNQLRDDRRRQARERQAMQHFDPATETAPDWERVQPVLDEAMADLNDEDRDALLLRFFKGRDFRAIGAALGVSDDAAQKRVSRALERLRTQLTSRGVTTTAVALSSVLLTNAVSLAPAGLAATLSTAALAGTTIAAAATATATKTIAMTTLQKTLIAAALTAAVGTGIYEARQVSRLRNENQNLIAQREALTGERDQALAAATGKDYELEQLQKNKNELLRLRGEFGVLRKQSDELGRFHEKNSQLRTSLANATLNSQPSESIPEAERQAEGRRNNAQQFVMAMFLYAGDNHGQFPTNYEQISSYIGGSEKDWVRARFDQFEIVYQGSPTNTPSPSSVIVVRENQASQFNGKWVKVYGFADGHSELMPEPSEGFEAWEKQRLVRPPPTGQ